MPPDQVERKEFLGRGWAYPVAIDPKTGIVATAEYEDDIKQAIRIILSTARGERLMRPEFGCGIHQLVFESIDSATLASIEAAVAEALNRFEARVEVIQIIVDPLHAADGRLEVNIDYRVRRTNQPGNLVYPFYFREGGRP